MEDKQDPGRFDPNGSLTVYSDGRYTLGVENGGVCLTAGNEKYALSCQPFEPCLYITDKSGKTTVVHNAFDPLVVLECFFTGKTVRSVTGLEYGAKDFCRMAEYAARFNDIGIDDAEKVFEGISDGEKAVEKKSGEIAGNTAEFTLPEGVFVIKEDPFYEILEEYPENIIDYCLVGNRASYKGVDSHFEALLAGALKIITDDFEIKFTPGKIVAAKITAEEFLSGEKRTGNGLNYSSAFLYPPYPHGYTSEDFIRLNNALFPHGAGNLEIYKWSTDWSDYFDDGHEWWGALCYTVYDKAADRFAVIMASATD